MGEAFLCKRGGGAGSVAAGSCALLCVKFPSGSSCFCEKDGERLAAENAPGLAAFALPAAGVWSVTIQNGAQEKSRSVTLSAGDVEVVTLAYDGGQLALLSPEYGLADGCGLNGAGASLANNKITDTGSGFWISPAIDLSAYALLTVKGTCRYIRQYRSKICVDQSSEKVLQYLEPHAADMLWPEVQIGTEQTVTLDVSALSGSYYIGFAASGGNTQEVTEITLSEGGSGA